jgi:small subunit ribosomal protein S13
LAAQSKETENPDFKYMVRIVDTDIDGNRPVIYAIQSIMGIGQRVAESIVYGQNFPPYEKIGNLSDEDIERLDSILREAHSYVPSWMVNRRKDFDTGKDLHLVGTDWKMRVKDDIDLLRKIRAYRGIRHETGQKVRGQRTKSNGRSGLTLGVSRKKS